MLRYIYDWSLPVMEDYSFEIARAWLVTLVPFFFPHGGTKVLDT